MNALQRQRGSCFLPSFRGCLRCLRAEPGIHFFEPDNQNWIPASLADKTGDGPGMTKRKSA
ncbi:MAG TPA: hypothetical protein VJ833_06675 [Rhodanobacteraceae bacterium]|nr:hypothetical protein [Rhodanobacteraceae bacterium]